MKNKNSVVVGALSLVVIGLGVLTGYFLSGNSAQNNISGATVASPEIDTKDEAGIATEDADTAEGVLEEGGNGEEGTHHLIRPGGEDQTVYLTSTVIDLSSFSGKKVQVWGKSIQGSSAAWFMDVERVKTLD